MIKAKPRKKREVKLNEKKEIEIVRKPTDEKIESLKLATILVNISRSCTNHKKIWDREIKENDGIIPFDKLMLISKTRATADKIFAEYFQPQIDGDIESDYEDFSDENTDIYNLGNYFKTKEEAQKVIDSKEWQDFWAKVRAGEIGKNE